MFFFWNLYCTCICLLSPPSRQWKHLLDYSRAAEIARWRYVFFSLRYGECSRSNEIFARFNIFLEFVLYLFMVTTVEAVEAFIGLQLRSWDCTLTLCVFALFLMFSCKRDSREILMFFFGIFIVFVYGHHRRSSASIYWTTVELLRLHVDAMCFCVMVNVLVQTRFSRDFNVFFWNLYCICLWSPPSRQWKHLLDYSRAAEIARWRYVCFFFALWWMFSFKRDSREILYIFWICIVFVYGHHRRSSASIYWTTVELLRLHVDAMCFCVMVNVLVQTRFSRDFNVFFWNLYCICLWSPPSRQWKHLLDYSRAAEIARWRYVCFFFALWWMFSFKRDSREILYIFWICIVFVYGHHRRGSGSIYWTTVELLRLHVDAMCFLLCVMVNVLVQTRFSRDLNVFLEFVLYLFMVTPSRLWKHLLDYSRAAEIARWRYVFFFFALWWTFSFKRDSRETQFILEFIFGISFMVNFSAILELNPRRAVVNRNKLELNPRFAVANRNKHKLTALIGKHVHVHIFSFRNESFVKNAQKWPLVTPLDQETFYVCA